VAHSVLPAVRSPAASWGGVEGIAEEYMRHMQTGQVITSNSVAETAEAVHSLAAAIRGMPGGPGGVFAGSTSREQPTIALSLNINGRALAEAVSDATSWRTSIASSSSTEPLQPAMTRPPETFSPPSIWPPLSFGSIEDRP
jgi:hypothetical protein